MGQNWHLFRGIKNNQKAIIEIKQREVDPHQYNCIAEVIEKNGKQKNKEAKIKQR